MKLTAYASNRWIALLPLLAACTASEATNFADDATDGHLPDETTGVEDEDTADETGGEARVPCDVHAVLHDNCRSCHGTTVRYGAPMSLVTLYDLRVPAVTDVTRPVYELVGIRIEDDVRPMPPTGQLDDADKQTLHDWIAAGAPACEGPACEATGEDEPADDVGPDHLPCTPSHTFTARAAGSDEPVHVPGQNDLYQCFMFASPFTEGTQATGWAPIIDDERVVHHWILYSSETAVTDGQVSPCFGSKPSDSQFVAGWAPGGQNSVMPENVGLELRPGSLILEIHYNNTAQHEDAFDRIGIIGAARP